MANITRRGERSMGPAEPSPWRRLRDLMEWDPFAEMMPFARGEGAELNPSFDIKETPDAYVFKADLPGVKEQDLDISLTGTRLSISGHREREERKQDERVFATECSYGSFTRSFTLPEGIDADHVDADLRDGVLTMRVPKRPETQPKKIALRAGEKPGDKTTAKA